MEKVPRQKLKASYLKWLKGELPGLTAEGLVTEDAAPKIVAKYEQEMAQGGKAWLVYVLGTFAAILLGVGVIMFFASNWEFMSKFYKLTLIFVSLSGTYLLAYRLKYVVNYPIIGEALVLLGAVFFGAGIFLVAQIFNIKAHFPNGVMLWMVGLIPLMMIEKSKPLLAQVTALFALWIIWELRVLDHWNVPEGAFMAFSIRFYLSTILLAFLGWCVYKFGVKANAFVLLPVVVVWLSAFLIYGVVRDRSIGSDHAGIFPLIPLTFFGALGILSILHTRIDRLPPFGNIYRSFALAGLGFFLYLFSFPDLMEEIDVKYLLPHAMLEALIFIGIAVWAFVQLTKPGEGDKPSSPPTLEMWAYAGAIAYGVVATVMMMGPGGGALVAILSNIALAAFIVAMIAIGTRGGRPRLVNYGVFLFATLVITRYFEWFWSLLEGSLFFIVTGLLLLVGGIFLERRRRALVAQAKEAVL